MTIFLKLKEEVLTEDEDKGFFADKIEDLKHWVTKTYKDFSLTQADKLIERAKHIKTHSDKTELLTEIDSVRQKAQDGLKETKPSDEDRCKELRAQIKVLNMLKAKVKTFNALEGKYPEHEDKEKDEDHHRKINLDEQ
jgi:hypothetical protein